MHNEMRNADVNKASELGDDFVWGTYYPVGALSLQVPTRAGRGPGR